MFVMPWDSVDTKIMENMSMGMKFHTEELFNKISNDKNSAKYNSLSKIKLQTIFRLRQASSTWF